ncbi:MAG TPA: glycosyltransferase family 4 protein [Propionicimonas sp.]|nr:glycosyltransferase family 4 protein [Propionicimonas sp.]
MRITLLGINYLPETTGIAPYTAGAAAGLAEQGHDITVVTGYPHYPQWQIADGYTGLSRRELVNDIKVQRLRHPVPRDGGVIGRSLMEVGFGLRAAANSWFGADVVLAVTPALLSTALIIARAALTRRPSVVWVQDIYTLSASQTGAASRIAGLIGRIESATLRHADQVVVIHDRFKAFVTSELGVDPARVRVVRNWTHLTDPGRRDEALRTRLGWAPQDVIVLHAGNMGAKQNLENVVNASQVAAQSGSRVRFVLMGDGHRRSALQAMGANPNLQFLDPVDSAEFADTLASADILLVNELPGMTEMSVPSKLTSYFHSGRPVLAAVDADSVTADEIAAAAAGIRVDPDDPASLLAAAEALSEDPQQMAQLGAAGQEYRRRVLSPQRATVELGQALIAASSPARSGR